MSRIFYNRTTKSIKGLMFIVLTFLSLMAFAQKKKEIKKLGIKTVVSKDYVGNAVLNDSKTIYNKNGKVTEEIKYDSLGNLKSSIRYKYNGNDDVVMETYFNADNKITSIKKYKYDAQQLKTEEELVDRDNRLIKKHIYSYNKNNLKTERRTYDAKNTLIATKKYSYEYTR